jgi:hypothetical protein
VRETKFYSRKAFLINKLEESLFSQKRSILYRRVKMSTSMIASYALIGKQVIIYGGIPIFIIGVLGGILNTLVFVSLQTFRQSSCAFYLTIMSMVNIGQLLSGLSSRILLSIYNNDGSESSLFYCKLRPYILQVCTAISMTCFCLATIDQYCATCSSPRFRQFCNMRVARRLVIIFIIIWILHPIPNLIFYDHVLSPLTGKMTCTIINYIYIQYRSYVVSLVFSGFLPAFISVLFGLMAYRNVQQLAHYALPLVRRELDKQLTVMVLIEVVVNFFSVIPFTITNVFQLNINLYNDPVVKAQIQLSYNITTIISYLYFAVSISID